MNIIFSIIFIYKMIDRFDLYIQKGNLNLDSLYMKSICFFYLLLDDLLDVDELPELVLRDVEVALLLLEEEVDPLLYVEPEEELLDVLARSVFEVEVDDDLEGDAGRVTADDLEDVLLPELTAELLLPDDVLGRVVADEPELLDELDEVLGRVVVDELEVLDELAELDVVRGLVADVLFDSREDDLVEVLSVDVPVVEVFPVVLEEERVVVCGRD